PCLAHLLNPIGRAWTKCYSSFAYRFPVFCRLMLRMGRPKSYVLSLDCGTQSRTTGYRRELYCGLSRSHCEWSNPLSTHDDYVECQGRQYSSQSASCSKSADRNRPPERLHGLEHAFDAAYIGCSLGQSTY